MSARSPLAVAGLLGLVACADSLGEDGDRIELPNANEPGERGDLARIELQLTEATSEVASSATSRP